MSVRRVLASLLALALVAPPLLLGMLSVARQWRWPALWPTAWQVQQWHEVAGDLTGAGMMGALARSLALALTVAVVATALGLPTSRRVAGLPRRGAWLTALHLPYALSPVVLAVGLLFAFLHLHLAGHLLGVLLAQLVFAYAYAVILLSALWTPRVAALEDLASTLGARRLQVWWRVLVPVARPMLAVCLFQTFLISWFDYALVRLIGQGEVQTLTIRLFEYFTSGDLRLAATCALILMTPPLVTLLVHRAVPPSLLAPQAGSSHE
ncbi:MULTISPECIES: ABC transporter permease [Rhodanobacter]|uniref:ABC transporter permease n=1 Tax=Rhodanobacter TaxID=75309 RepID=UPI0009DBC077|nr:MULTISPECIES: ABC transporter permease subunit [Rhodanobacter]TAN16413.1 MAG: ABC transporter permease subunit [Rhodanobacter sp.]UJJ53155.1 ABC transporter permease subunit [Rhodanobacter thiooxydans]